MSCKILVCALKSAEVYQAAIHCAKGEGVIAYCPENVNAADWDGLLLCGGSDMDPAFYGKAIDGSVEIDRKRDETELAALEAFLKAGKPVMGICRGFQLLNVAFGGTLIQNLPNVPFHRSEEPFRSVHNVTAAGDSLFARYYGETFSVNSCHHQGVERLGNSLRATAFSPDGLTEALEHTTLPVFGVQWHPERLCGEYLREDAVDGAPLFSYFVRLCQMKKQNLL